MIRPLDFVPWIKLKLGLVLVVSGFASLLVFWHGMEAMRISVSNWSTTEADADLSVEAILRCLAEVASRP